MYSVEIVKDSINEQGNRLVTLQACYPRVIHSEVMTYRMFSRNAQSSRATPVSKVISNVREDPYIPLEFGINKQGMVANSYLEGEELDKARDIYLKSLEHSLEAAEELLSMNVHKQVVNRLLEPYSYINTLISATKWNNFLYQRCHKDADPAIQKLAYMIKDALNNSEPELITKGGIHLPYITNEDRERLNHNENDLITTSVARCARVSRLGFDLKETTLEQDTKTYNILVGSDPKHGSPLEHIAKPLINKEDLDKCGNFTGFTQLRKFISNEYIK